MHSRCNFICTCIVDYYSLDSRKRIFINRSSVITIHFNNVQIVHISFILLSSHKPGVYSYQGHIQTPFGGLYTPVAIFHSGIQLPTGYSCTVAAQPSYAKPGTGVLNLACYCSRHCLHWKIALHHAFCSLFHKPLSHCFLLT